MLDGVVIENEVAHAVKSGKKPPSMMFKVDFENAYDTAENELLCKMDSVD